MSEASRDSLTKLSTESATTTLLLGLFAHLDGTVLPNPEAVDSGALPRDLATEDVCKTIALLGDRGFLHRGKAGVAMPSQTASLVRESLSRAEVRAGAEAAVELLLGLFPEEGDDFVSWPRCEPLVAPATAALRWIGELETPSEAAVLLQARLALYLHDVGRIAEAREMAERARTGLERVDATPPDAAYVHRTLGCILLDLDESKRAEEEVSLALELDAQALEDWHPQVRRDRIALSSIMLDLEDFDAAKSLLERALEDNGERPPDRVGCAAQRGLAWTLLKRESRTQARDHYERAVAAVTEVCGPDHPDVAVTRTGFGVLLYETGEIERSLAEQSRALEVAERLLPDGHPSLAVVRSNLADSLRGLGRRTEARAELALALAAAEATFPPNHSSIWIRLRKLASVLEILDENQEALHHAERALAIAEEAFGAKDLRVAQDLTLVARIEATSSEDAVAARVRAGDRYRRAFEIAEDQLGPESPVVAYYLTVWGDACKRLGELRMARDCYGRALAVYEQAGEEEKTAYLRCRVEMATLLWELGQEGVAACSSLGLDEEARRLSQRCEEAVGTELEAVALEKDPEASAAAAETCAKWFPELALGALTQALDTWSEKEPDRTSLQLRIAGAWQTVGRVWMESDPELAEFAIRTAVPLLEADPGFVGLSLHAIGELREAKGDWRGAAESYAQAAERKREAGERVVNLSATLMALGRALKAGGRQEEALDAFQQRLQLLRELGERDPLAEGVVLHEMAASKRLLGQDDDALSLLEEAVVHERKGKDHAAALAISLLELGRAREKSGDLEGARRAFGERMEILTSQPERDLQAEGVTLHDIADVCRKQERHEEARHFFRQAAERKREAGENPSDLAVTLLYLAREEQGQKNHREATAVLEERLKLLRAVEPRDLLAEAVTLHWMGWVWHSRENLNLAVDAYVEAAALEREGEDSRLLAITLLELGRTLLKVDDNVGALAAYEERLNVLEAAEERDCHGEGVTWHDIADLQREQGNLEKAAEFYARAADLKREAGRHPRDLATTLLELGRTLERSERYEEAMRAYEERLEILRAGKERDPQAEGVTLHDIADLQRLLGNSTEALDLYRQAAELKRQAGENLRDLATTLDRVASLELERGDPARALDAASEAISHLDSLPKNPVELRRVLEIAVRAAEELGRTEEVRLHQNALAGLDEARS